MAALPGDEGALAPEDAPPPGRWEKTVLAAAAEDAPAPSAGDRVTAHVVGSCGGAAFEDSRARGLELALRLGRGNFVRGLDAALAGMRVGERASVTVDADAGWGACGNRHLGVPPNACLCYDVELLGAEAEPELWDLGFEQKLELAEWRRARGAVLYGRGHAYFAHEEFLQGQRYLAFMLELTEADAERVRRAQAVSDLNCAATALRLGLERDALKHCAAVLAVDPPNAKAHYRAAQAHAALGDICAAEAACDALCAHHPADPDGPRLRLKIRAREEALARRQQRAYRRMFASGGAADDGAADDGASAGDGPGAGVGAALLRRLRRGPARCEGAAAAWWAVARLAGLAALGAVVLALLAARWR